MNAPAVTRPDRCRAGEAPAGAGSMAWTINCEIVLLLGWSPAVLLQLAHPLVAAGVAEHSLFLADPRGRPGRLRRTIDTMLALTFGTPEQVAWAARGINAIHDRVNGRLGEGAGVVPAGTAYSAHDPALLRWVHATMLDVFPRTYELYVGPLTADEKDRYCAEASGMAPLLGIPDGYLPASTAELRAYMAEMLAGGEIVPSKTARILAREIVEPPLPRAARPLLRLAQLPTFGLLPPRIREAYGFAWDRRRERALRVSAATVRAILSRAPSSVRHWPAARVAFGRARAAAGHADCTSAGHGRCSSQPRGRRGAKDDEVMS
jgi:uncharacterized protein (DUF2236 family)